MDSIKKGQIKNAIAAGIVLLLILIAIVVVYKYSVEGENNMPFKLSRIVIGSMVVSEDNKQINSTEGKIVQNNGVYIELKKNDNYNDDAVIKKVEISNIQITNKPKKGDIKIYIPNTTENEKFTYSDEFVLDGNMLTYNGASKSDTTALEINNQGGIVAIAFGNTNLGEYSLTTEELKIDGTMLKSMGILDEDIEFSVNFDLIIYTEGKKFKTNIDLDLPISEISDEGKASQEITDTSEYVFKRI